MLEIAIGVAFGIILTVLLAVEREARLAKREVSAHLAVEPVIPVEP
jgi:hypothetical protein